MECFSLFLDLTAIFQELLTEELGLVKLDSLRALLNKCHYRHGYLVPATLSHNFTRQYLGHHFNCLVLDVGYGVAPFLLLQFIFLLHGLRDGQVIALPLRDVCRVLSFAWKLGYAVN